MMPKPATDFRRLWNDAEITKPTLWNKDGISRQVLFIVAFIDHALACLLRRYFVDDAESDEVLSPERGALGSLVAKARLARCVGLIDRRTLHRIKILGRIRNEFAHSAASIDLSDPRVIKLCADLGVEPDDTTDKSIDITTAQGQLRVAAIETCFYMHAQGINDIMLTERCPQYRGDSKKKW